MRRVTAIASLLTACTAPVLGTDEAAIRGGTTDDGDPAVVALSIAGLYPYCTATLIAPHTLLTAGHCNSTSVKAQFGTQASAPDQSIDVAEVALHPMYTGEGQPYDFALMKLAADPVGITPIRLNDLELTDANVGQNIRHVGFGVTDDTTSDGEGTRRTVTYTLDTVEAILIYSGAEGEQTCSGDSGGPAFMMLAGQTSERLTGIVSDGPNCDLSQDGWDDRVDVVEDWIVTTVSGWDAPPSFGEGSGSAMSSSGGCAVGGDGSLVVVGLALLTFRRRRSRCSRAAVRC